MSPKQVKIAATVWSHRRKRTYTTMVDALPIRNWNMLSLQQVKITCFLPHVL